MEQSGRNLLGLMVKKMCEEVGIAGKIKHSLHAKGASRLITAEVPEKLIMERTGRGSKTALRKYEHTSVQQQATVSSVLASTVARQHQVQENTSTVNRTAMIPRD